ncbi:MAG: ABC-2 family transporter protein [Planctomycetes bacterium]|nr:ABC-2 family transporter protein [Planctomycetota bacterium]
MRVARLAWLLFLTTLKRRLAYRGDLLLQGLDELCRGFVAFAMLKVYTSKAPALAGWTEPQLLFVLGFAMVPIGLFHCLCGNLYQLSNTYIIQGNLDRVLLRPYPTFLQICFDRIAIEDLSGVVLGIALMAYAAARIPGFDASLPHLALLLVLLASAFAVIVAVFMAFAATGFWFEDRVGMVPPVYNLMEFGRWPPSIYHAKLRWLLTVLIPFSFTAFYPASLFADPAAGLLGPGLLTPVVAVLALTVSTALWRTGIKRYGSAGS